MTINVTPYEKNYIIRYLNYAKETKLNELDTTFHKEKLTKYERETYYKTREEVKDIKKLVEVLSGKRRDDNTLFRRTKDTIQFEL